MKRPQLPRRGTPVFLALNRVHALGGTASVQQLLNCLQSQFNSTSRLDRMVIRPLINLGFLSSVKEGVRITPAGREYIESDAAPTSLGFARLPAVTQEVETAPLSRHHLRLEERRPGSLDYRKIPSLIAGKEVPFAVGSLSGSDDASA